MINEYNYIKFGLEKAIADLNFIMFKEGSDWEPEDELAKKLDIFGSLNTDRKDIDSLNHLLLEHNMRNCIGEFDTYIESHKEELDDYLGEHHEVLDKYLKKYTQKRDKDCSERSKKSGSREKKLIDAEIKSYITSLVIAIFVIGISCYFLCSKGYEELSKYADEAGYYIGFGSAVITIMVSIICRVVNTYIKKHYDIKAESIENNPYSNDELLAARYGDNVIMHILLGTNVVGDGLVIRGKVKDLHNDVDYSKGKTINENNTTIIGTNNGDINF